MFDAERSVFIMTSSPSPHRPLIIWLWIVALLVVGTVWVGGMTRLTESGLSMVDWKPLMGALPPLSEADWAQRFDDYQAYPEYQELRPDMDLAEFKNIFLWEYGHRMLGRVIGIVFLIPYLVFLVRRQIPSGFRLRIFVAFLLGGSQGLLGWYMVKSGLSEDPYVSHFRLAAHFSLALLVLCYLVWTAEALANRGNTSHEVAEGHPRLRLALAGWSGLLGLQVVYGALVAGLNSGYSFPSFPKMLGHWVPPGLLRLEPAVTNLVNNSMTVQFIHRGLAWLLMFSILALWIRSKKWELTRSVQKLLACVTHLIGVQFVLGVATVVLHMPIVIASLHQVNICLILILLVRLFYQLRDAEVLALETS